jgi:hypothetical protein
MSVAAKSPSASNRGTLLAGLALLAVVFLVIALPGIFPADAAHTGVMLVGP